MIANGEFGPAPSGFTVCEVPAIDGFITITNTVVVMLQQLAEDVRSDEPGAAEVITTFTELVAGRALDLIGQWPA